jgi:hypothetical protein
VSVSQPLLGLPSQSANPALHASAHAPVESQLAVPLTEGHGSHAAAAQPVSGSLVGTQPAPQSLVPVGHDPPVPDDVVLVDELVAGAPPPVPFPPLPDEVEPAGPRPAVEKPHAPNQAARPPRSMAAWANRMSAHHATKPRHCGSIT